MDATADPTGPAHVVIGLDDSDSGQDALALGVRLAQATGAVPVVATAYPASPSGAGHVDAEWAQALREQAEQLLARAREQLGPEVQARYEAIGSGSASHALDALAEQLDASVVVVGSGRGGPFRRTTVGSTAERLLQGASVPVVVTPRGHRDRARPGLSSIGSAFIDAADAREALLAAARLAARASARVTAYSVVAPPAEFAQRGGRDAERAFTAAAREGFAAALDKAVAEVAATTGVPVTGELLEGDVVSALAALDDRDLDLLVVGSRGYGPVRRVLLGGTSSRLVRSASCPVMVVPRSAAGPLLQGAAT